MSTYSDYEQRMLDQQSGAEMDRRAERRSQSKSEVEELEELLRGPLVRGIEFRLAIKNALAAGVTAETLRRDFFAEIARRHSDCVPTPDPTRTVYAAAPELLAACKALMPEGWDDGTMDHMPGIKLAREAIAKAEGRS